MTTGKFFQEVNLPEQKSYADGVVFPVVLSPASNTCSFIEAIKAQKPWLESLLEKNGVIFFRGFHVETPSDFNDVVEAFGFPEAPYLGGRAVRTKVVGRIYTANEAPPDKRIPFHHEMAYVPDFPNKLFFFCEEEPGSGGETPVVLSHIIYEKMKEKHPEFVSRLEEHGLTYIKIMCDEVSTSYFGGIDWRSAYMTDDKNVAEERAAKQETRLEWIENGVKLITGPLPAIRIFGKEDSQRKTWFNILTLLYSGSKNDNTQKPDTFATYGNGDPMLEYDAIEDCLRIMDEECVIIPWKKGKFFQEVNLPEQKSYADGVVFPVVLSPASNTCSFIEAIKAQKPWLESLLEKNGVIFFRGFHVETPSDFNDVVEAFGFPEAPYLGGRAPRTKVVGRIYTANEAPPDKRISFHHEMTYVPDFPNKLFFFCEEEPGSGGETPIVLSHIIYEKMKERHPDFVSRLEEHGVTYIKIMNDEVSSSYFGGSDWRSAYMTDDKNVAEERAAKQETKLEWFENGVKLITGPLPAIRIYGKEDNQRKTWFNILTLLYSGSKDSYATYGNGDPVLEYDAIEDCLRIMDEECVIIPWKKGDVMLVNNLMVLHARQPLLKPPRRVLASLCM